MGIDACGISKTNSDADVQTAAATPHHAIIMSVYGPEKKNDTLRGKPYSSVSTQLGNPEVSRFTLPAHTANDAARNETETRAEL
jgi:hypothetical protein